MLFKRLYSSNTSFNELLSLVRQNVKNKLPDKISISHDLPRFQVISNESFLKSKSFFIKINDRYYLFNCSELLNRHLLQHDLAKSIKFENIFITQKSWSCSSGLTSYIQANKRKNIIRLHAPFDLKNLMNESNFMLKLNSIILLDHDYHRNGPFKDENLRVEAINLNDSTYAYNCITKNELRFLVIDCPNEEIVNLTRYNKEIARLIDKVDLVVHLSDFEVLNCEEYQKLLKEVSENSINLYFNSNKFQLLPHSDYHRSEFNSILPYFYPIFDIESKNNQVIIGLQDMNDEKTFEKFTVLAPKKILLGKDVLKTRKFTFERNDLMYPQCIFLGTSSSAAQPNRNHTGIVVNLSDKTSILLDCGEGTLNQFVKYYGKKRFERELSKIKAIYVSHFHIDHHIGLINFLEELLKHTKDKIYLCLPTNLIKWLKPIDKCFYDEKFLSRFDILNNDWLTAATRDEIAQAQKLSEELVFEGANDEKLAELTVFKEESEYSKIIEERVEKFKTHLDIIDLITLPVNHVSYATAVKITLKNKFNLVFSGDCRPSNSLVKYAKNCDLLIHEATYSDVNSKLARSVWHSTTCEAIQIGEALNAKHVVLTHFHGFKNSPMEVLNRLESKKHRFAMAFDFLTLNQSNLHLFSNYHDSLRNYFSNLKNKF